jgi:hypothetical protein
MAMRCELRGRLQWWWRVYVRTLSWFCFLFGAEPNWERVEFWARRAVVIEAGLPGGKWKRIG